MSRRILLALDRVGADNAQAVLEAALKAAKGGDMRAAELILSRVWPARKGRPVSLPLPPMETASGLVAALGAVVAATAAGELTPEEGQAVAGMLEVRRRAFETVDLEGRLAQLEARNGKN